LVKLRSTVILTPMLIKVIQVQSVGISRCRRRLLYFNDMTGEIGREVKYLVNGCNEFV